MTASFGRTLLTAAFLCTGLWLTSGSAEAGGNKAANVQVDVIIGFKTPPGQADRDFIKKQGGTVTHSYWIVPAIAARVPQQALAGIARNPNVSLVEPDVEITANDAELDAAWGVQKIGGEIAHTAGATGSGVKVAVIDTGIDYRHPDLDANYSGGWDFVNNDADPLDDHGHGTHCAGTIGAEDNGVGVVGVAPNCRLYALKVMDANGSGSFSRVIAALQWCVQNGIQVTSNSYGSTTNPGSTVQQAFDNAALVGIVSVAAAGNYGTSAGTEDNVCYPARYNSVIAVGATTSGDVRASYSCTGPKIELAAPGSNVYSTTKGGGYGNKSGTSMACPHVAGAAAVLVGAGLTNDEVRYVLDMSALDLGTAGTDTWYGYGGVDLATALEALATLPPEPEPDPTPTPDPVTPELITVDLIVYSMYGGKTNNKNLRVEVDIVDDAGLPVPNATVSVQIWRSGTLAYSGPAVTDSYGTATFTISGARSGTYVTNVTDVTATGYEWDGTSPTNAFAK
ncbi:MAG: S8 family serine peptidase [Planctomycetaceae bacterium]|nr:S8 family serine peptidase [Planctomycetaceae bacterium]